MLSSFIRRPGDEDRPAGGMSREPLDEEDPGPTMSGAQSSSGPQVRGPGLGLSSFAWAEDPAVARLPLLPHLACTLVPESHGQEPKTQVVVRLTR